MLLGVVLAHQRIVSPGKPRRQQIADTRGPAASRQKMSDLVRVDAPGFVSDHRGILTLGRCVLDTTTRPSPQKKGTPMRITAIAVAVLAASTLVTANAGQAEATPQPAVSHFYPLQPSVSPSPGPDPRAEVQDFRRQVSDLHGSWDSLSPEQRNQRIAQLQQQITAVDKDIRTLPPDQQKELELTLAPSTLELADLLRKAQASAPQQPCILFFGPPPCGI